MRERLALASDKVMEKMSGPLSVVMAAYDTALPYAVQAFHYGFIPLVVYFGFSQARLTQANLKWSDLLSPM